MKIRIKNYVGISRAEIDIDSGIALIGGDNAVGKSSVIKGVQALLTGELTPRGITKGGSQALVMDGKKMGQLQLSNGESSISIAYPDPQYVTQGEAPTASKLAVGIDRYTEMNFGERSVFLTALLRAYPTLIQLNAALRDDLELPEDAVNHISMMVGSKGWDDAVLSLTEKRVKLKGQWEGITGERYGEKKAVEWLPDGWNLGEVEDGEQLTARVASCQEAYDRASKQSAVSEAEHKALRELAGKREPVEMTLATAKKQLPSVEEAWAKLRRELDALPPAVEDEGVPCPHCGAHVRVTADLDANDRATYRLHPVEPMLEGEVERRKRALAAKREAVREAHTRLESQQQLIGAAEEKLRLIATAEEKLKLSKVGNGTSKAEALREQLERAVRDRHLWNQRQEAQGLQVRVEAHQAVIDLLGPKGMRRTTLLAALAAFERDSLDPLTADMATWKPITIDRDTLLPLFGGRPYSLLSKSEQYRVDITLQVAIALLEGASMICLDGADILSHSGQDDMLMELLAELPFPVIIGATYSRPKACPNFDNAEIGHSYWVNAGKLVPLAEALA